MQINRERLVLVCAGALTGSAASAKLIDRRAVDAILADIEAQGFVVVPREPTLDMLQAGRDAVLRTRRYGVSGMSIEAQIRNECVREAAAWSAMIDAGKGEG